WYTKDSGFELTGFLDADYAGCKDTFKSTSGGAQFLGKKLMSWSSKKQDCTSLSTAKSEYVSLSACCAQVLWMRTHLTDYGYHFDKIQIYCDSKSAIAISCNPVQHSRTKHIAVRYHFIKEHVEKGTIELYFVKTDYQLANIFTKALLVDRFNYLVRRLGMRNLCPQELDRLAKLHQNRRDLPKDTLIDRLEVLSDDGNPSRANIKQALEQETEETAGKEQSNCQGSTAHIQPLVVPISIPEPDVPKSQPKPNIPYHSRLNDQKLREKATIQMEKFFQIFHDFHFNISFADALLLMPKFASTIKSLLTNKDKLFELAKVPLNENCSAMLLKKLPEKLGDPGKFLIPCDFLGIDGCHALADLDRSITLPKGVAEDIFVKDRSCLIDVYGEEITLRVNDESVTFNLNQTMRYSSTYDDNLVNRVDVIDIACEEFVQYVLDFKYNSKSSNPTLVSNLSFSEETMSEFCKEPIVKSSSPILTPFGESDFFLKEIEDFLKDESNLMGIEDSFYDPEGDILYLEKFLNDDPSQLPPIDLNKQKRPRKNLQLKSL
nr:retrovirus-related Pol polyprotein from transposon TNT 1-94 [Tanacetum cinerariifolium]